MLTTKAKSLLPLPVTASNTSDSVITISAHCSLLTAFTAHCLQSFKYSRGAHPAADAHRHHSVTTVATFQLAQYRSGEFCAGTTKRMPKRDCAAVHIYFVDVEAKRFDHGQRLRRKRFIEFDHIDLIKRQSGQPQSLDRKSTR